MAAADGGVFSFGDARSTDRRAGWSSPSPVVGMAVDPATGGYWLVASDGGIFAFDDPVPRLDGRRAPQQAGGGDGRHARRAAGTGWSPPTAGSSAFGDARFPARPGASRSTKPVVGMAVDPATGGYWLVASDGGIFAFGRAVPRLDRRPRPEPSRWSGWPPTPSGGGYWLVASDGGIFAYGDATFLGSASGHTSAPIVGMATTAPTAVPPAITTNVLPIGTSGVAYPATTLAATGGTSPDTWSATGLPPGLRLSTSGVLIGTPTQSGDFAVTFTVKDSTGATGTKLLALNVVQPAPLAITTTSLPEGTEGLRYSTQLVASGGVAPYVWSVTGLPPGLAGHRPGPSLAFLCLRAGRA